MKTVCLVLVLVAVASAQLGGGGPRVNGGAARGNNAGGAGGARGATTGGGIFGQRRNWGPRVYGPGVNNNWAFPPNPFSMQRAVALVNQVPGAFVRVDLDGEITITNRFGQEADIIHPLGYDLSELIE